jgi:very-short-patch-repair endonuclease
MLIQTRYPSSFAAEATPLCPAGHLPHKGGDQHKANSAPSTGHCFLAVGHAHQNDKLSLGLNRRLSYYPISPLVGEMPGRAEGGVGRSTSAIQEHRMPHAPVPPRRRTNAKLMRKAMTDAELMLWNAIRAHRLMGLGFRRQVPIDRYIVDFACSTHRLIVEVDGSQHGNDHDVRYDAIRTRRLEQDGWTVLRFWNDDVLKDVDNVCLHILTIAGEARP